MLSTQEQRLIDRFELIPHPEGGYFKEVFRSSNSVQRVSGDSTTSSRQGTKHPSGSVRSALTDIYFLLAKGDFSCFHKVNSDEAWHHLDGGLLKLTILSPDLKHLETVTLQPAALGNAIYVVPANWWQAASPLSEHSFCSCTVGPGFDFEDFEMARNSPAGKDIIQTFPALSHLV